MNKGRTVNIDGAKLREELKKRKLTGYRVSEQCGHSRSWLHMIVKNGKITDSGLKALEMRDNIRLEDIAVTPENPKVPEAVKEATAKDTRVVVEIDYDELQTAVYHAVYGAVKKALAEFAESR